MKKISCIESLNSALKISKNKSYMKKKKTMWSIIGSAGFVGLIGLLALILQLSGINIKEICKKKQSKTVHLKSSISTKKMGLFTLIPLVMGR